MPTAVDCKNNGTCYHEFHDSKRKKIQANGRYEGVSASNQRAVAAADSVEAATASDNVGDGNQDDEAVKVHTGWQQRYRKTQVSTHKGH